MRAMRPLMLEPEKGSAEAFRGFLAVLRELLAAEGSASIEASGGQIFLVGLAGEHVILPPAFMQLLESVVDDFEQGQRVAIVPVNELLTTTEAAEMLNVSRPYFARLLDQQELPFEMVGTHRRVRLGDVLAYLQVKDKERRAALDEMVREGEELGFRY